MIPTSALTFFAALAIVAILTPITRSLALRLEVLDQPHPRKIHASPKPLLGGVAIYLSVVLSLLLTVEAASLSQMISLIAAATLLVAVGLVDDFVSLNARLELFVAIPLAGLALAIGGFRITTFPLASLLAGSPEAALVISYVLTVLWVVGITSAFAILDHMDGLCAGLAALASSFFLLFALMHQQGFACLLFAAMLGASLGFLKWNFKPASIFMGDSGAMFVGLVMSAVGIILGFNDTTIEFGWMIPMLILGIPIFDSSLVIVSRSRRGLAPSQSPGKDHTAHRLAVLGLGEYQAVLLLYGCGLGLGGASLLLAWLTTLQSYVLLGVLLLCWILAVFWLERAPYERQKPVTSG